MDFEETPEEQAFRAEVRAWLEARAKRRQPGTDPEHFYSSSDTSKEADAAHVRACKAWQQTLYDAGWAGIAWPKEFGGRGGAGLAATHLQRGAVALRRRGRACSRSGSRWPGPTIIAWGTDEQQQRFLAPMLSGEHVWCQLFSEPGAGSDLAGLRTRAVPDGEQWVVNGQKVWTSGAHHSDWGLLLARTDLDAPKHKGITAFLLDMHTPGIEVRPLRQINGMAHFNEVFLTDVARARRVPARHRQRRLARREHDALERAGDDRRRRPRRLARHRRRSRSGSASTDDPVLRQQLAHSFTRLQLIKWLGLAGAQPQGPGSRPGGVGAEARGVAATGARRQPRARARRARRGCSTTATRSRTATGSSSS